MMNATPEESAEQAVHEIARHIAEFRAEFADRLRRDVLDELATIEASGYDPARGRGRGPWWADGASR